MYDLELNDIMFFVNSIQNPSDSFNIRHHCSFSSSNTRSSIHHKLQHTISATNYSSHFFFNRFPRLWNSLPPIDLTNSPASIKATITDFLWTHFEANFDPTNPCTFHFLCPCNNCSSLHSTIFKS